jgi:hypothetical protein
MKHYVSDELNNENDVWSLQMPMQLPILAAGGRTKQKLMTFGLCIMMEYRFRSITGTAE